MRLDALFCFGIGLPLAGLALWLYRREQAFAARAVSATATIVALDLVSGEMSNDNPNERSDPTEAPIFQFTTPEGLVVRARSRTSYQRGRFAVGQSVTIRYDPARPEQAEHADSVTLHLPSLITACLGGGFIAVGVALLLGLG